MAKLEAWSECPAHTLRERIGNEGEEGKRGIIIPKDKFKECVDVQRRG